MIILDYSFQEDPISNGSEYSNDMQVEFMSEEDNNSPNIDLSESSSDSRFH